MNDLIRSDNSQWGEMRAFLFQKIEGPSAGGGVEAHVGHGVQPAAALGVDSSSEWKLRPARKLSFT
jgi:hypothetical protein